MLLIPIPPAASQTQQIPQSEDGQIAMGIILLISLITSIATLIGIIIIAFKDIRQWYCEKKRKDNYRKEQTEEWKKIESKNNNT